MAVYPAGGSGPRQCPIVVVINDVIDQALRRATPTGSQVDLKNLLSLIQHELDMRSTLAREDQHHGQATYFSDAADVVGRVLRITAPP